MIAAYVSQNYAPDELSAAAEHEAVTPTSNVDHLVRSYGPNVLVAAADHAVVSRSAAAASGGTHTGMPNQMEAATPGPARESDVATVSLDLRDTSMNGDSSTTATNTVSSGATFASGAGSGGSSSNSCGDANTPALPTPATASAAGTPMMLTAREVQLLTVLRAMHDDEEDEGASPDGQVVLPPAAEDPMQACDDRTARDRSDDPNLRI